MRLARWSRSLLPWTVAIFGVLLLTLLALVGLVLWGDAQIAAEGSGVMMPDQPRVVLRAPFSGRVLSVSSGVHESGRAGQALVLMDARAEKAAYEQCAIDLALVKEGLLALEARAKEPAEASRDPLMLVAETRDERESVARTTERCDALLRVVAPSVVVFPVDATVSDLAVSTGTEVREGDVVATLLPPRRRGSSATWPSERGTAPKSRRGKTCGSSSTPSLTTRSAQRGHTSRASSPRSLRVSAWRQRRGPMCSRSSRSTRCPGGPDHLSQG